MVVESIVVIGSILIAFALDAWWDARQAHARLRDDLVNVLEEVESNLQTLDLQIRFHGGAVSAIDRVLDEIEAAGSSLSLPDTVVTAAIINVPTYDPATGAIDALIATGGLSQLGSDELRSLLAAFEGEVRDVNEDELAARRVAHEVIVPLYWDTPQIAAGFARVNDFYARGLEDRPLSTSMIELPNRPGLAVRLHFRRTWLESALREISRLREHLELSARLIAREIAE